MTLPRRDRYGGDLTGYTEESFKNIDRYIYDEYGNSRLNHRNVFIRVFGLSTDNNDQRPHEQLIIPKDLLGRNGAWGDLGLQVVACVQRISPDQPPWPEHWKPVDLKGVFTSLGANPFKPPPAYQRLESRPRPASRPEYVTQPGYAPRPGRPQYGQGDQGRNGNAGDYGARYYEQYYKDRYGQYYKRR